MWTYINIHVNIHYHHLVLTDQIWKKDRAEKYQYYKPKKTSCKSYSRPNFQFSREQRLVLAEGHDYDKGTSIYLLKKFYEPWQDNMRKQMIQILFSRSVNYL